jgi:ectoine hydroxylase-related dioxygenase (phytanoyl-CoA dioxygenase family)
MQKYSFIKDGFEIIKISNINKIKRLKKKILDTFSFASELNNFGKIKNDKEIEKLYIKNKKVWIAAYDQVRMLPEIYHIIDENLIKLVCKKSKIKFPSFTSKPVVRICMPDDKGTSRTDLHVDYPTHRGSLNSVTVWMPLHNTNKKNGTLSLASINIIKKEKIKNKIRKITKKYKFFETKLVSPSLKLGEAIVLSQFTPHTSGKNLSNQIRYSIDFRFNDLTEKRYAKNFYYINQKCFYKKTQ